MAKVYIAGPITGVEGYKDNFIKAAELLRSRGMEPVDPTDPGTVEGAPYKFYIDRGLKKLIECDAVLMLPGWEDSKGAFLECYYAQITEIPILFASSDLGEIRGEL